MFVFFQAEDGIRYLVRSRGLGDVYKRQALVIQCAAANQGGLPADFEPIRPHVETAVTQAEEKGLSQACLLYTSDAADERSSVDLGGRRIIKKKKRGKTSE